MASLVTSIIGGIQGANAAGNAANTLANAYGQAGQTVVNGTQIANQGITGAGQTAGNNAVSAAQTAGQGVTAAGASAAQQAIDAGNQAGLGVTSAASSGANGVTGASGSANGLLSSYLQQGTDANRQLSDYLSPGGAGSQQFTGVDLLNDPGYQFRLAQGQKALERSAAARGALSGGGALKALTDYSQGAASAEFQGAFDRFRQNRQDTVANLSGLANRGYAAASESGQNQIRSNEFNAGLQTDAARTAGAFGTQAAQYAGDRTYGASQYAGNALVQGTHDQGVFNTSAADQAGANTIKASQYLGDTQIGAGEAKARGILGKAGAWNGALNSIGQAGDSGINGYLDYRGRP